ncbi:MAG: hypothetical protein ACRC1D_03420 [Culicoidibacterales bacterium]
MLQNVSFHLNQNIKNKIIMFDISKSKLYSQIMSFCVGFFSLSEDATETEVHAAMEDQKPLVEQLEEARNSAVKDLSEKLDTMKKDFDAQTERISALEKSVEEANAASKAKDERIAELQTEIAGNAKTVDALKAQHQTEVNNLAGQVATLKAGNSMEQDEGGQQHQSLNLKTKTNGDTVIVQQNSLKKLLKPA